MPWNLKKEVKDKMYDFSDYVSNKESFWDALVSNSIYQCIYQWLILVILIAMLVLVILILIAVKKKAGTADISYSANNSVGGKVVFCKKCGNQYNSECKVCPSCGTKRMM